ncbi:MAG: hypothetical protein QXQ73_03760 [Desulfurococcaceae archaeon]
MHNCSTTRSGAVLVVLSLLVWSISTYLHDPATPVVMELWGLKYSDVVYGVFYQRFSPSAGKFWFNGEKFAAFIRGDAFCPIPYIDYHFEYPPLTGFTWALSTCIAFAVSRDLNTAARLHYYVQATFSLAFLLAYASTLNKLALKTRQKPLRAVFALITPTLILYLVYNWDIATISLALLGMLALTDQRYLEGGLLLGASFSAKLLTAGIAYYFFVKLAFINRKFHHLFKYTLGFSLTGLLPLLLLYVIAPQGFFKFIEHHATWYCENCIYMVFIQDIWSPLHRYLYPVFSGLYVAVLTKLLLARYEPRVELDIRYAYAYTSALIVFNYVFSPQMLIVLLPLAVLALKGFLLLEYAIADLFNAALIVEFFAEMQRGGNPWILGSSAQLMALTRNILVLLLLLQITLILYGYKRACTRLYSFSTLMCFTTPSSTPTTA